jgi:hypothetical protein
MDQVNEEFRTIVKSENTLCEDLGVVIENEMGYEIGTLENTSEIVKQVLERISQTSFAISLLDPELHAIPLTALKNLNEHYHLPALQNAQERLRQAMNQQKTQ